MTIYEHAEARVRRHGMTEKQAERFLLTFGAGRGQDIGWGDVTPFLSSELAERIDEAAYGWLLNPENCEPTKDMTVREWKEKART